MAILRLTPGKQIRPKGDHTLLLVDVSASMAGNIDSVREDAQKVVAKLSNSDYLSVIIFSGHDTARLIVGPVKADRQGKTLLNKAIREQIQIMNTTVFSEPLKLALSHLQQNSLDGVVHQAILFTDGCAVPTRSTVQAEHNKAYKVARELAAAKVRLHTVGYGTWYDQRFLEHLHKSAGYSGIFRHIADIEDFDFAVLDILAVSTRMDFSDIDLEIMPSGAEVTSVYRSLPELLKLSDNGEVRVQGLFDGSLVYYLDVSKTFEAARITAAINGTTKELALKAKPFTPEEQLECVRITAAHLILDGKASNNSLALDLLRQTGDDAVVDNVAEAYTERERRVNSDRIRRAFRDKQFIGAGLKQSGPSHNVLNILRLLMEDDSVVISIPSGIYKRGGLLTRDPRIVNSPMGATVSVVGYTSHKERLNFSFVTEKAVKVRPVDEHGSIDNAAEPEDRRVHRTYNLIRDGELVLPKFFASMSEYTFGQLQDAGVIAERIKYEPSKSYQLDLSHLKMVSSSWARPSLLRLGDLLREEKELEAEQSVLNASIKARESLDKTDIVVPEYGPGNRLYIEKSTVDKDAPQEHYEAPLVKVVLLKYNTKDVETRVQGEVKDLKADELITRVQQVRRRLRTVRWLARCIVFASHLTGWKSVRWGEAKTTRFDKDEQLAQLGDNQLKLVTGKVNCVAS
jgi:hypothetical protein